MATFRKQSNGKWTAEVCVKGKRKSKTFPTKTHAKNWAAETELSLSAGSVDVSSEFTLSYVFTRYAQEVSEGKKGAHWEIVRLKMFERFQLASVALSDLRREDIEQFIQERLRTVKPSSVNRELNLISHCLTQARRWRLMTGNPMQDLRRPKNPPHRDRRISPDEEERLLLVLDYHEEADFEETRQRVALAFLFALETAMRAGEICSLTRSNIDYKKATAYLPETKNGLPRYVPLSSEAIRLLKKLPKREGEGIFDLKSGSLSTIFRRAVSRADIDDLVFHDTRHEAITRLAQKLDVLDLARTVGHTDLKQLNTYYNKSAADIAKSLG